MEKRVIIAIALCVGILFAWAKLFPTPTPSVSAPQTSTSTGASEGKSVAPSAAAAGVLPGPDLAGAGSAPARPSFAARQTTIATPVEEFVFTSQGATLKHARLLEDKYLARHGDRGSGVDLIRGEVPEQAPLRIGFPDSGFSTPADDAWQVVDAGSPPGTSAVAYRALAPGVAIEKRFIVDSTPYRLHLDVTVENRSNVTQDHHLAIQLFGHQDPEAKGGFFSGSTGNTASVLCRNDDKTVREPVEKIQKDPFDKVGAVSWIGTDEKFFLVAVAPYPEAPPRERRCTATAVGAGSASAALSFADRQLAPGARTQYSFAIFVGPKVVADLDDVRPGGQEIRLTDAVDVSLAFISRPMLWLLKLFHGFVGNWGVAIILLTVFIRLLTFYPTQKSLLSAKKMQKLGPKMAAIRKKYEGDKQRQSVETMNLYKANGVSPFGGCLPSLIQMPIWIALYSTLNYAVELYRSPFILHIRDLTAKDPYYVTPLLMGGVMFVQMKMSPTSPDNQQQATMAVMMPVMFTAFSLVLPSGLAVYMLTSYLIGIVQQLWINHLDSKANAPAPAPARR